MIKDVKNYINIVGSRLTKAFSMEEFGTEQELEFWSLSAEHMSRKELPSFVDIVQWIDLLYKAPVHFVYKIKDGKLVLHRRHIITKNILKGDGDEKMPHEQTPQQKEFVQNFEHQVQNIEKKMEWDDEFKKHGISSHSIGQCEHIPLYTKAGDIWGVYFVGPYIKSPEQIVPKLSIVGRVLSNWLIQLEETESNPRKQYDHKIREITSDLGTGKLNTEGLATLIIRYIVHALNAEAGAVIEYKNDRYELISSTAFDDDFISSFNLDKKKALFTQDDGQIVLNELGQEYFSQKEGAPEIKNFTGQDSAGCILIVSQNKKEFYHIEPILDSISDSIGKLFDYREQNKVFSEEYLDTYYQMLRAIEKSREKTRYHTPRMMAFVERFGMFFGLENNEMAIIKQTARFHDIGYVGATSLEQGKTIGGELTHPIIGGHLIERLPVHNDVVEGIKTHHEWVNGKGTPKGLTGEEIPWTGKIIGVFEYVVDFIETHAGDSSKDDEEWISTLSKGIMERADVEFDMVLIPTVIQLIQALGWEDCTHLGVKE